MGLLLSRTHLHGENNSPQSAFYTYRILFSSIQFIHLTAIPYFLHDLVECKSYSIQRMTKKREFHHNRKISDTTTFL